MFQTTDPVYLAAQKSYDEADIMTILKNAIAALGFANAFLGKAVTVKPNLVRKMNPELGGTTHPVMLSAAVKVLKELGARSVLIAESPGGLYNPSALKAIYQGCGIEEAAKESGAELNYDCSYGRMDAPNGEKSKNFEVTDPYRNAEIIVNLSKLKSHGMLGQSCAAKNFFGIIPGVLKFEMHARFPDAVDFAGMLADINGMLHEQKEVFNICDGIVGMEGNGPTNGTPKALGVLLFSKNPFNIDLAAAEIVGFNAPPELLCEGIRRGWCPKSAEELTCIGGVPKDFAVTDYVMPDTGKSSTMRRLLTLDDGRFAKLLEPRPVVDTKKMQGLRGMRQELSATDHHS